MKHICLPGYRSRRYQSHRCQGRDLKEVRGGRYQGPGSLWSCADRVSSLSGTSLESLGNNCAWTLNPVSPITMSVSVSSGEHRRLHPPSAQTSGPAPHTPASWNNQDDETLMSARSQGLGWGQINKRHFPAKTPNACRKRYERVIAKRRGSEWDHERLEGLKTQYRDRREAMWKPVADAINERWQDVEKAVSPKPFPQLANPDTILDEKHPRN
jgi:hypothetical protein